MPRVFVLFTINVAGICSRVPSVETYSLSIFRKLLGNTLRYDLYVVSRSHMCRRHNFCATHNMKVVFLPNDNTFVCSTRATVYLAPFLCLAIINNNIMCILYHDLFGNLINR